MTTTRCLPVLALLLASCGSDPRSATGQFVVRYHPPPGALFRYEVLEDMAMGFGSGLLRSGDQEITFKMYFTQEIADPGGGHFRITTTVDSVSADAPGLPRSEIAAELKGLRGRSAELMLDDRMQVVSAAARGNEDTELPEQLAAGIRGLTFTLPEGMIAKGDRWTVDTPLPLGAMETAKPVVGRTTFTVKDVRVIADDTTLKLTFLTLFPKDPIETEVEGRKASVRLTGQVLGDLEYSVLLGTTLSGSRTGNVRVTITAAGPGRESVSLSLKQRATFRLLN